MAKQDAASYKTIVEGSATMVYPADQEQSVFYNPVQVQNRDLSVLMIALYAERRVVRQAVTQKRRELRSEPNKLQLLEEYKATLDGHDLLRKDNGLHILDALAASGLRSLRYWKEIKGVHHITINDLEAAAVERAHTNLKKNDLQDQLCDARSEGIRIHHGDAMHMMYRSSEGWDVIDLDPYGSAAPFLDGAVQAVRDGGMLNVTCTDMAALGGSHPETCYGRYASMPIQRAKYLQEAALRILLYTLATTAARYGRTIRPILSVGMNFYVRCFVEIYNSKAAVNDLSLSIGSVYQSAQCPSFHTIPHGQRNKNVYQPTRAPPKCEETGGPFKVGGPMWLGPLHDLQVVKEANKRLAGDGKKHPDTKHLATKERLLGLLTTVEEELPDVPLYYTMPDLCHTLHCSSPPLKQIKSAIQNAGYRVSGYHKEPQAIKTDAPNRVVWDIMRVWCQKNPPKAKKKKKKNQGNGEEKEVGEIILAVEPVTEVDFTYVPGRKSAVARFPMNPEKNWGPKPRAVGHKRKKPEDVNDEEGLEKTLKS